MYVRSITFAVNPGVTMQLATSLYHELTSIVADADGFLGSSFMMNMDILQAVSLTFWRDRECGAAAGELVVPLLLVKVHSLVSGPPEIAGYDVIGQSFGFPSDNASTE